MGSPRPWRWSIPSSRIMSVPPCEPVLLRGAAGMVQRRPGAARWAKRQRLPREERLRGYKEVEVRHADQFFDAFKDAVPVAVELRRNAKSLIDFVHPEHALYVFGPEDGSLGRATLAQCHRFLVIPTRHCANLSAAVYTVLYDRHAKRVHDGLELLHSTAGDFDEPDHMADAVGVTWGG
jgi:tRNA(Leu) C34 or U34 (ribose-2'-O)-methylase TrmL